MGLRALLFFSLLLSGSYAPEATQIQALLGNIEVQGAGGDAFGNFELSVEEQ